MPTRLTPEQRLERLRSLPGWSYRDERGGLISKEYRFKNFVDAFEFMRQMAVVSETLQHHPEWSNVYQRVSVVLTTHDAGGLTDLDVAWATEAEAIAREILGQGPKSTTFG